MSQENVDKSTASSVVKATTSIEIITLTGQRFLIEVDVMHDTLSEIRQKAADQVDFIKNEDVSQILVVVFNAGGHLKEQIAAELGAPPGEEDFGDLQEEGGKERFLTLPENFLKKTLSDVGVTTDFRIFAINKACRGGGNIRLALAPRTEAKEKEDKADGKCC